MKKIVLLLALALLPVILFSQVEIKMEESGGVYYVPCKVNGLPLKLIFDTGASDVSISATEAVFMLKNGYLSSEDMHGTTYSSIANGDIVEGTEITIKEIEIGGITINDISATVVHSINAPLLLGQSAIKKMGTIKIDNGILTIYNEQAEKLSSGTVKDELSKAFFSVEAGEYEEGIIHYKNAIRLAPEFSLSYSNIASAYAKLEKYDTAILYCEKGYAIDHENIWCLYNMGIYLVEIEEYDRAEKTFYEALSTAERPGTQKYFRDDDEKKFCIGGTYCYLGDIYEKQNKFIKAEECYNKTKSLQKDEPQAYLKLADLYFDHQDAFPNISSKTIIDLMRKGISYDPSRPSNMKRLVKLAYLHMKEKDPDNAIDLCRFNLQLAYDYSMIPDPITFEILSDAYFVKRDYGYSAMMAEVCGNYAKMSRAYFIIPNFNASIDSLDNIIRRYPSCVDALYFKSLRYEKEGKIDEALKYDMKILEYENSYEPVYFTYAEIYNGCAWNLCMKKEYENAYQYITKAISLDNKNGNYWDTMGEVYYGLKKYDDCISAMTTAISLYPNKNSYKRRGEAYIKLGNKTQGNKDLKVAKEMD